MLKRNGGIQTARGLLEIGWNVQSESLEIELSIPRDTTVRVDLESLGMPALDRISINSRAVPSEQIETGFILLSSHDWTVTVGD
jgi:hypothetical protein